MPEGLHDGEETHHSWPLSSEGTSGTILKIHNFNIAPPLCYRTTPASVSTKEPEKHPWHSPNFRSLYTWNKDPAERGYFDITVESAANCEKNNVWHLRRRCVNTYRWVCLHYSPQSVSKQPDGLQNAHHTQSKSMAIVMCVRDRTS